MKNFIRKSLVVACVVIPLFGPSQVLAASCGIGRVTSILEGGWHTDDLMFTIDYSHKTSDRPKFDRYIRYTGVTLSPVRMAAIRASVKMAYATGTLVRPFSHFGDCGNATEILVDPLKAGINE